MIRTAWIIANGPRDAILKKRINNFEIYCDRVKATHSAKSVSVQVAQELMRHKDDVVSVSSDAWTQIPRTNPLPKAANGPGRQTLGELGNGRAGDRHSSRQSIQRRRSAVNGRVVPTIMEEDDDEHASKLAGSYGRGKELTEASKEPWNWPEDVF